MGVPALVAGRAGAVAEGIEVDSARTGTGAGRGADRRGRGAGSDLGFQDAYLWRATVDGMEPLPPDRFSYAWRKVDAAVDDGAHVRLHDLRHYHGTMLVGAGVPLPTVRDRLGHSSLTVTNIYVDGRPEWDRRSADIIGAVLDSPS
jgi:integrase